MSPERRPDVRYIEMCDKVPSGTRRAHFLARRTTFTLLVDDILDSQKAVVEGISKRWYKRRVKKMREKMKERGYELKDPPQEEAAAVLTDYPSVSEQALT